MIGDVKTPSNQRHHSNNRDDNNHSSGNGNSQKAWIVGVIVIIIAIVLGVSAFAVKEHKSYTTATLDDSAVPYICAPQTCGSDVEGAQVQYDKSGVNLSNKGSNDWSSCTVEVNITYGYDGNFDNSGSLSLSTGDSVFLPYSDFTYVGTSARFNPVNSQPQTLSINCNVAGSTEGSAFDI